jgi:hypothetical protein
MGKLVSITSPLHPQAVPNALSFAPGNSPGALPSTAQSPWSDHNTSVVELTYPMTAAGFPSSTPAAELQSVHSGHAVFLGPADFAAGDPQRAGAFIAVPAPGEPPPNSIQPDAKIELHDAGSAPVVLATAAMLNRDLGIPAKTQVSLTLMPNSQGTMVAVNVESITASIAGPGGVVVLSRTGKVLGTQPPATGGAWALAWSPSAKTLAFLEYGPAGLELTEWTIGGQSTAFAVHVSGALDNCLWSPDGVSVLCAEGQSQQWVVIQPSMTQPLAEHGMPLAWLSGQPG